MRNLDALFRNCLNKKLGADFEKMLDTELRKAQSKDADFEELLRNYRFLIGKLVPNYCSVRLDENDLSVLVIDGKAFDLDSMFSHGNRNVTESRMAIESLLIDLAPAGGQIAPIIKKLEQALNNASNEPL